MNNMNYLTEILLGALSLSSELLSFFGVVVSVECGQQRHGTNVIVEMSWYLVEWVESLL